MPKERYAIRFDLRASGEEAEVMIYSGIENEKWWGDETTPADFDKALKEAVKGGARKLNVRINSPGGDVYSAVAMRSMIMNAGFESVRVMIEGLCASAATIIATVPGANVVIAEGSEYMIHNPWTLAYGNASEIEKVADHLHQMEAQFGEMYAAKSGQSEEQIRAWMDSEKWFTAKEAVESGFCDELLETQPVAACVTGRDMALMKEMYRDVPEDIVVKDEDEGDVTSSGPSGHLPPRGKAFGDGEDHPSVGFAASPPQGGLSTGENDVTSSGPAGHISLKKKEFGEVSNEAPVAGASTEINTHEEEDEVMDIKDITMDQLRAENPALVEAIRQAAVADERQRQDDIEALTIPGYEDMAQAAKRDGTSAMDFQKQIVAAMKQKGGDFLKARQQETGKASEVRGGNARDIGNDLDEIEKNAREIAAFAKGLNDTNDESMF